MPWGGGHVGYPGLPVSRQPTSRSGIAGGVIFIVGLILLLIFLLVPHEDIMKLLTPNFEKMELEVVGASVMSIPPAVVDQQPIHNDEVTVDEEILAIFPEDINLKPTVAYAWQLESFNEMKYAVAYAKEVFPTLSDVEIYDALNDDIRYKVICAVRYSRSEVVQWERDHPEHKGFIKEIIYSP